MSKADPTTDQPDASSKLQAAREKLSLFLSRNPSSSLVEVDVEGGGSEIHISKPWGDASLGVRVPIEMQEFTDSLNNLYLPERLTAIWHADSNDLEVIFTALALPPSQREVKGRKFSFHLNGKKHQCEFRKSSDRLLSIAKNFFPRTVSSTNWRNLQSFSSYTKITDAQRRTGSFDTPLSFWVGNIRWNESLVLDIIANLNFYMSYYDSESAIVLIHSPIDNASKVINKTRYVSGAFPKEIQGLPLDTNLLNFWSGAWGQTPLIRYILFYRIIEYASSNFLDYSVKSEIKKLLIAPDRRSDIDVLVSRIADAARLDKLDDIAKFKSVIRATCKANLVWREIEKNRDFFAKELTFDGGFKVRPIVHKDDREEPFCAKGLDGLSDTFRKIRNALSHGKDQETAGVITPTTRNIRSLQPWVHLIETVAGEVVLYKGIS